MKQIIPNLYEIDEIGETVHCYAWEWSQGITLIDTGMPGNGALMRLAPLLRVQPVSPDMLLVDGQELPDGFIVVHTPGHTPGHISLLHRQRRLLITGDALSNTKGKLRVPDNNPFTSDVKNCQRSVWKLAKKYGDDYDVIVFGHGAPILNNGGQKVKSLASQIFSAEV